MKKLIVFIVVFLSGCATGERPYWQQELDNLHRQHRAEWAPIVPESAKVSRPDYSAAGLYSCGIKSEYPH